MAFFFVQIVRTENVYSLHNWYIRLNRTLMDNLVSTIHLTYMLLDCGSTTWGSSLGPSYWRIIILKDQSDCQEIWVN